MHVHLVGGEINATFDLTTLRLVSGTVPADLLREVLVWLNDNHNTLLEEWKKWQP